MLDDTVEQLLYQLVESGLLGRIGRCQTDIEESLPAVSTGRKRSRGAAFSCCRNAWSSS